MSMRDLETFILRLVSKTHLWRLLTRLPPPCTQRQMIMETNTREESSTTLSLLDRSVSVVLKEAEETASGRVGVSPRVERLHRLHGTSLISDASTLLSLRTSTFATACTIFHRFYQQVSLAEYDVWSIALASVLLATKVEEEPQSLKRIIHSFFHMFRKRILVATNISEANSWNWKHPSLGHAAEANSSRVSKEELENFILEIGLPPALDLQGSVYGEWYQRAISSEATILRQLGFTLYWIPDSHPHKFIPSFCQALGLKQNQVR